MWKNCCRLCACDGINEVDIFFKDMENSSSIADDLKTMCNLKLEETTDLPSKICNNCKLTIETLINFLAKVIKTQQMFNEFQYNQIIDCDSLRKKFKLTNNSAKIKEDPDIFTNLEFVFPYESKESESITIRKQEDKVLIQENSTEIFLNSNKKRDIKTTIEDNFNNDNQDYEHVESSNTDGDFFDDVPLSNFKECGETIITKTKSKVKIKNVKLSKKRRSKLPTEEVEKNVSEFQCKKCDKIFLNLGSLTVHLKKTHFIINSHSCKVCSKKFSRPSSLKIHEKSHLPLEERSRLPCPRCDRTFTSESGRWSHIYTVHDKKMTVICEECGKEFSTKPHLVKHKICHSQEKNLQCPHCPGRFKSKAGLTVHMEIHGDSFPCSLCGALLNTKQLLKKHMVVHSDAKDFKCNFCHKEFKRPKELYSHLITHIGLKPFECRICNQKFVYDMTYRRHLKSVHAKEYADMVARGERISSNTFPKPEQLKAINEAAKNKNESSVQLKSENCIYKKYKTCNFNTSLGNKLCPSTLNFENTL